METLNKVNSNSENELGTDDVLKDEFDKTIEILHLNMREKFYKTLELTQDKGNPLTPETSYQILNNITERFLNNFNSDKPLVDEVVNNAFNEMIVLIKDCVFDEYCAEFHPDFFLSSKKLS